MRAQLAVLVTILGKELTEAGVKVLALERGAIRRPAEDFALPRIRDELRFSSHNGLMQNPAVDTLTIRNNTKQTALPMRHSTSTPRMNACTKSLPCTGRRSASARMADATGPLG